MNTIRRSLARLLSIPLLAAATIHPLGASDPFPGTSALTLEGDLAAQLVGGIDRYLDRVLEDAPRRRARHWNRDLASPEAYVRSIETNRQRFASILGIVDRRVPVQLRFIAPVGPDASSSSEVGRGAGFRIHAVTWPVFRGVEAEGLLLQPDGPIRANIVALPDCDGSPEQLAGLETGLPAAHQFARRLAENGCRVVIPSLIDRGDSVSGLPGVRKTRQSQREILWRAAYEMGRTIQGYEIQRALAAIDWLADQPERKPIGILGYGEGGMIAFYAGALDARIQVTGVSGFSQSPRVHNEPIYRNVWSITDQFGGAEIAGLIAPRGLVYAVGQYPEAQYPPAGARSDGAAPGRITRPSEADAEKGLEHAIEWLHGVPGVESWKLVAGEASEVFNAEALGAFAERLGVSFEDRDGAVTSTRASPDKAGRLLRSYTQVLEDTQALMRESEFTRREFWKGADRKNAETFAATARSYRDYFFNEIIGPVPPASLPANPRTRKVSETDAFSGYEVVLDVHPDVFAYGILLVPKGIPAGERRPVVVCQHGLEGRPTDVADPARDHPAYHTYACRLAERGFVVFAPQNAYIGENRFRQVLRKAQPLKLTLWSFIHRQHEVILEWLASQSFVDPARMAFYGLSYGGKTAMRIPPLLDRYCLSICSADYNEWIWKNVSIRHGYCYLHTGEYDMPEFNLGNTFNYAELSWLILPRPFMVERGHDDGVAPDEWVAYEFAKTRRQYVKLGLGDRTEIEFFDGPHTIHGVATFDFLHRHLRWPKPTRP